MNTYTIYRPTETFMSALNEDKALRELHLRRSNSLFDDDRRKQDAIDAINTMLREGHLVPAATVIAEHHNALFRLTNSINHPWIENDGVTLLENSGAFLSSSSVGDIFTDQNGHIYLIESYGFTLLEAKSLSPLQVRIA